MSRVFLFYYIKHKIQELLLSSGLFPIVGMGVEIVLYDIHQRTQSQAFLIGMVLHMKYRVECPQEGFHLVPAVHLPPFAQQQGADQFDKISHCPVEQDDFFFYHVFFPDGMFEQPREFVTLFFHFPKFLFEQLAMELQCLCRLRQKDSI